MALVGILASVENIDELKRALEHRPSQTADSISDKAESNAARALMAAEGLVPYVAACRTQGEDMQNLLSDILGDLHHLADGLQLDWDGAVHKAECNYSEELAGQ